MVEITEQSSNAIIHKTEEGQSLLASAKLKGHYDKVNEVYAEQIGKTNCGFVTIMMMLNSLMDKPELGE